MSTPSARDTLLKQEMGQLTSRFAAVLANTRESLSNIVGAMPRDPEADGIAARARTVEQMLAPLEEEARELGQLWSRVALAQWGERRAERDCRAIGLLEDAGFEQNDGGWEHCTLPGASFRSKWAAVAEVAATWEEHPLLRDEAVSLLAERRDEEGA